MKIEELRIDLVDLGALTPEWRPLRTMQEYPGGHRIKFAHRPFEGDGISLEPRPGFAAILRIQTADDVETAVGEVPAARLSRLTCEICAPGLVALGKVNEQTVANSAGIPRRT